MTKTRHFTITAQDSLFFRDGRPFNQDDEGLAQAHSHFPPYPSTMSGAIRTALGAVNGKWDKTVLGDGSDNLGQLSFGAPTPICCVGDKFEPLYPAPLALLGHDTQSGFCRLAPGAPLNCDLGDAVVLPQLPADAGAGWKTLSDKWITASGLSRFLEGGVPEEKEVLKADTLWPQETRISLARELKTRGAREGLLYTAAHVCPQDRIALAVEITGLPDDWPVPRMMPLGGEGRFAWLDEDNEENIAALKAPRPLIQDDEYVYYKVVLLSPARLTDDGWRHFEGQLPDLPGHIQTACLERTIGIGGWNSNAYAGQPAGPRPLRPFLPAGCVFFMHAAPREEGAICDKHLSAIGEDTRHGFGRIAIGTYQPKIEASSS